NAASRTIASFKLKKANQTITAVASTPLTYNQTETLSSSGSSGTGTITFAIGASDSCSLTGTTLKATSGTGSCSVTASIATDNNYNSATSSAVTVNPQRSSQTITASAPVTTLTYNQSETLRSSDSSGTGAITFAIGASDSCSLTGTTLKATSGTGSCSVTASIAADNNYSSATSSAVTVNLQKASQTITASAPVNPLTYNQTETPGSSGSSGSGAVTFAIGRSDDRSLTGTTLKATS